MRCHSIGLANLLVAASLICGPVAAYEPVGDHVNVPSHLRGYRTGLIGITIWRDQEFQYTISKVEKRSPAEKAGLRRGDLLVKIDGTLASGKLPEDIVQLLHGPLGSWVVVTASRNLQLIDFKIKRSWPSGQLGSAKYLWERIKMAPKALNAEQVLHSSRAYFDPEALPYSEVMCRFALKMKIKEVGEGSRLTLPYLKQLGKVLVREGKEKEAEPIEQTMTELQKLPETPEEVADRQDAERRQDPNSRREAGASVE